MASFKASSFYIWLEVIYMVQIYEDSIHTHRARVCFSINFAWHNIAKIQNTELHTIGNGTLYQKLLPFQLNMYLVSSFVASHLVHQTNIDQHA